MTPMTRAQRAEYRKTEEETQLDVITARMLADMNRLQLASAGGQSHGPEFVKFEHAPATVDEPVHAPPAPWLDGGQGRSVPDAVEQGVRVFVFAAFVVGLSLGYLAALLSA